METKLEAQERQLKFLRTQIAIFSKELNYYTLKQLDGHTLTKEEFRTATQITRIGIRVIKEERKILGFPAAPTRITNPKDIDRYLEQVGIKEPAPNAFYNEVKETMADFDKLLEYRKRLQGYIDQADRNGTF